MTSLSLFKLSLIIDISLLPTKQFEVLVEIYIFVFLVRWLSPVEQLTSLFCKCLVDLSGSPDLDSLCTFGVILLKK